MAWKVLEKINFDFAATGTDLNPFGDDMGLSSTETQTLKEIMMTLSGTIINRKVGGVYEKHNLKAKGDQESFLKSLMGGGKITYYKCQDAKCLHVTETTLDLSTDSALQTKVTKILESIVAKIQDDDGNQTPAPGEMALINATTLPVYKFINVTTAFQKGHAPLAISEYGELIAFDVVYKYVADCLDAFRDAAQSLQAQAFTDEDIKPFIDGLHDTKSNLMHCRGAAFKRMDQLLGFVQKTQVIEQHLQGMMGMMPNEFGI
jgi:conjugative transfer pilus assembly protein TraH